MWGVELVTPPLSGAPWVGKGKAGALPYRNASRMCTKEGPTRTIKGSPLSVDNRSVLFRASERCWSCPERQPYW